jgi:hypothetical protein
MTSVDTDLKAWTVNQKDGELDGTMSDFEEEEVLETGVVPGLCMCDFFVEGLPQYRIDLVVCHTPLFNLLIDMCSRVLLFASGFEQFSGVEQHSFEKEGSS